jgi:4-hydroxybutyryl-CoA dehydratase/vinylacetyl-CoA-Delta-isomerase
MGIKTGEEYVESLKILHPNVYIVGEKVDDVVSSPYFQTSINETRKFYDWTSNPETKDDFCYWSDLIGEEVSFWTHIRRSPDELIKMVEVMKRNNAKNFCSFCMGIGPCVFLLAAYDIDQAKGTNYYDRLMAIFKKIQKEDLRYCVGIMDPKGDRSLPPSKQADPDLYLRIVDKNSEGIIVNGAKMHTSSAPITHYIFCAPGGVLREEDKDYAVAFITPIDTEGLTFITRPAPCPLNPTEMSNPASMRHSMVECLSVFDNVFIPWENVFMCGEWEFTQNFIHYFSSYGRPVKATCLSARTDMIAGAASLIAEYNGVGKASHIRHKINDMAITSQIGWGCVNGAIARSTMHPSGLPVPDISISNAGLYHTRLRFVEFLGTLMEIAGGVVTTMPLEVDYRNEETRHLIEKYFKAKSDVPTEDRLKLLYFIQELTASRFGGYFLSSAVCAVGTPETNKLEVLRNYDLMTYINNVKEICNISTE